jgi:hypothetical protein
LDPPLLSFPAFLLYTDNSSLAFPFDPHVEEGRWFMAESSIQTLPKSVGRGALRIVLFGMPAAGKSSLLGALAQAAQTQEHLLNGRLADPTHGLGELQHRLYEEEPRRTVEEVVPYAVDFEPFSQNGPAFSQHLGAVLIDCDGRVANDLLVRRRTIPEDSPEGTLASEVLAADTLLLAVDASAPPDHVDEDFVEFLCFLRLLERSRGERSEVGGLPVFLVLTKCDLLAQPSDAPTAWLARIEERKRQVEARFNEFLRRKESEEGPLPFGRIDLHLWATSVKRPALAGSPPKPREPYGVAELFRHCLEAAKAFRDRRRRSNRRLARTVAGAGVVVIGMVGLTVALLMGTGQKERQSGDLENRVANLRASEGQTPAERLRGDVRQLEDKIDMLTALRHNPQFEALPADSQQYVNDWLDELQAYVSYFKRLQRGRQPADVHGDQELQKVEETLKTKGSDGLDLPRGEWSQTRAGHLHHDRLEDVKLLRNAIDRTEEWYLQKKSEGERLWTLRDFPLGPASINWLRWHTEVNSYLTTIAQPPFVPETDKLPGATSLDLTYQTIYAFDRIQKAAADLAGVKKRLVELRQVAAVLGLGGQQAQALLVLPADFTAAGAATRLQSLRQTFPELEKTIMEIEPPEAARGDVEQAAKTSYKPLIEAGQAVVLRRLQEATPGGPETPKTWQIIRPWLENPTELSAWRVLARMLERLSDLKRTDLDPVADLSDFLGRATFDLSLKRLSLEVPDALQLRPDGGLTIRHSTASSNKETRLAFTVMTDKQRDAQRGVTTYWLMPKDGSALTYRPGDDLTSELPVRDVNNREMKLTWARGRSGVYQFEHLVREPRLHPRSEDPLKGQVETAIRLSVAPGQGSIPLLPDLVPIVMFRKTK